MQTNGKKKKKKKKQETDCTKNNKIVEVEGWRSGAYLSLTHGYGRSR